MVSSTARERILLHLGSYEIYLDRDEVPYGITQPGIAEAVGVSRSHVSYEIKGLMEKEELVREEIRRVEDQKRKRKVYFLTAKGLEVCDDIRGRFEDGYITVITCEGKKQVELNEIDDYLEGRDPLLKALSMIDDDDDDYALDLRKGEPSGERIFVGREEELERMKNLLGGVEKGDSRTLFIVGEPGIGKTTLVSEFSQYAKKKGFKFLEGKAYFETAAPFLPLREIFDDLRPDMKEDRLDIFDVEKGNKFEEEEILKSQRKAAFYQSAEVIKEVSKDIPLVLFIDDLQWADGSTLKLLHYLSESLKKCRVFFLGAFRPMGSRKNRFLDDICRRMKRENRFESIELKPLDRDQTKEIISNIMAVKDPPSKFVELIYEYCEGNPLFTEECIKKLAEEGTIEPKKGLYPNTKDELEVPDVVTRVLEGRFDRYSDETREVLEYGSVIGETIPYELLLESSGMEERTMLKHISHLLRSDLWHEASEQEVFRFSHTLFKFAAYRSIPELKREKLHEVVSGSIKEVYADDLENYYSDIAMHLEKSDNIEEALKFFILAGQRAEKVYAQEEALEMYEKALELVEELSDEIKKGEILESLGDVNKVLGNYGNCIENYQGSMLSIEDEKHRQRMYRKIAAVNLKRSSFEEAIQQVDNGLSLLGLGSKSAKEERCRLLQKKGWALMFKGDHDEAEEVFKEERSIAESLDRSQLIGEALHDLGSLYIQKGDHAKAEELLKKTLKYWKKVRYQRGLAKTHNNIGAIYKARDDLDLALEHAEKSLEKVKKIGDKDGKASALTNIGNIHHFKGDLEKAERYHRRSLETFKKIGNELGIALALDNLGLVYRKKGGLEKALKYHREALEMREKIGEDKGIAFSHRHLGTVLREQRELEEALHQYERALEIFEGLGDKNQIASTLEKIGDAHRYRGDHRKAVDSYTKTKEIREEIENYPVKPDLYIKMAESFLERGNIEKAEKNVERAVQLSDDRENILYEGSIHRVYAMIEECKGDKEKADEHFSKAAKLIDESGNRKERARCLLEEGKVLIDRGKDEKGFEMIKKALNLYEDIGLEYWEDICKELL